MTRQATTTRKTKMAVKPLPAPQSSGSPETEPVEIIDPPEDGVGKAPQSPQYLPPAQEAGETSGNDPTTQQLESQTAKSDQQLATTLASQKKAEELRATTSDKSVKKRSRKYKKSKYSIAHPMTDAEHIYAILTCPGWVHKGHILRHQMEGSGNSENLKALRAQRATAMEDMRKRGWEITPDSTPDNVAIQNIRQLNQIGRV